MTTLLAIFLQVSIGGAAIAYGYLLASSDRSLPILYGLGFILWWSISWALYNHFIAHLF